MTTTRRCWPTAPSLRTTTPSRPVNRPTPSPSPHTSPTPPAPTRPPWPSSPPTPHAPPLRGRRHDPHIRNHPRRHLDRNRHPPPRRSTRPLVPLDLPAQRHPGQPAERLHNP